MRLCRCARFSEHHQAFGTSARIGGGKCRDVTGAHADDTADGLFEFLRVDVMAATDDDVLLAAGDEQFAVGEIAEVAGVKPVAIKQLRRRGGVFKIAGSRRRPTKLDATDLTFGQRTTGGINDAYRMTGKGMATAGYRLGVTLIVTNGQRQPLIHQRSTCHPVDARATSRRWKGQTHRAFRQAIDRHQRRTAQPTGGEPRGKAFQRQRTNRFSAVAGHAPAGQV